MPDNEISCKEACEMLTELRCEEAKRLSRQFKIEKVMSMAYSEIRKALGSHKDCAGIIGNDLRDVLNASDWTDILKTVRDLLTEKGYTVEEQKRQLYFSLVSTKVSPVGLVISGGCNQ